jgi:hypothetical protein
LDTLNGNNLSGAEEVLGFKTIQKLKDTRAKLIEQLSKLVTTDGRRVNIQNGLARINAQIETETKLVQIALTRDVAVAKGAGADRCGGASLECGTAFYRKATSSK